MTKAAAIYSFWSSFGIPAYEENSVTSDTEFPYITYQFISDEYENTVLMTASIWYKSTSWVEINRKSEEISEYISNMKAPLKCDNGRIWIKKGTPFSQSMGDESNDLIKRKYLNIEIDYLTFF